jgi:hypothetical protein
VSAASAVLSAMAGPRVACPALAAGLGRETPPTVAQPGYDRAWGGGACLWVRRRRGGWRELTPGRPTAQSRLNWQVMMRWHDRSQPRAPGRSAPGSGIHRPAPSTGKVIEHDHNSAARQPAHPVGEDCDRRRSAPQQGAGRDLTASRPILPRPPRGVNLAGRSCCGKAAPRRMARAAVSGTSRLYARSSRRSSPFRLKLATPWTETCHSAEIRLNSSSNPDRSLLSVDLGFYLLARPVASHLVVRDISGKCHLLSIGPTWHLLACLRICGVRRRTD